jgi:hypothetical protein
MNNPPTAAGRAPVGVHAQGRPAGRQGPGEAGHLSNPLPYLLNKLSKGDVGQVSEADLTMLRTVVGLIHQATGAYAVRVVIERGWPQPTRERCRLGKNLYRRAVRALVDAGMMAPMSRGAHPMWRVTREKARAWASRMGQ